MAIKLQNNEGVHNAPLCGPLDLCLDWHLRVSTHVSHVVI